MKDTEFVVDLKNISKSFGGVKALTGVNFRLLPGEVHALLGGNGAGKSTVLKVLNGVHQPDSGSISIAGRVMHNLTPETARESGIAMIFQELSLIPSLSVAQNVFLTRENKSNFGLIDDTTAEKKSQELFNMLDVDVNPKSLVSELGAGQRQLTEIVKAISQNAKVLVLDEPSTALSVSDVERLFVFLRKLKKQGVAIVYVSHRMDEIARIADRATIFRDGRNVITAPIDQLPIDTMIEYIVGKRSLGLSDIKRDSVKLGKALLTLKNVSGRYKPNNISLSLHQGEVIGLAGLLGSGRSSLAKVIAGVDPIVEGEVFVNSNNIKLRNSSDAITAGIALVPESRATQGMIASHSLASNITLPILEELSTNGIVNNAKVRKISQEKIRELNIKTASQDHAVSTLSGGNQQKVVISKWLVTNPDILILDEPTAGIDIGSKSEIIELIRDLAREGKAILMISSELTELLAACDRIAVMNDGEIFNIHDRKDLDDPTLSDDPENQLQDAEQKLQLLIQDALTIKS